MTDKTFGFLRLRLDAGCVSVENKIEDRLFSEWELVEELDLGECEDLLEWLTEAVKKLR